MTKTPRPQLRDASRLSERRLARRATRLGVQSVEIGMSLVTALAECRGPLSLKALSAQVRLSPSKAHRYLASFTRCELVTQDPETGLYDLGPLALRLGLAAQNRTDVFRCAFSGAEQLARRSGHTAMVTAWSERGPAILRWVQGSRPVYTTLTPGAALPLLRSATGRVYLTYLPRHLTQRLITAEQRLGAKIDVARLRSQVRKAGYAEVRGELIPGLVAVAAPIFEGPGTLASVLTLISTKAVGLAPQARAVLGETAREVSRHLGWSESSQHTSG